MHGVIKIITRQRLQWASMVWKWLVWSFYVVSELSFVITAVYATVLYSHISGTLTNKVDECTQQLNLVRLLTDADTGITNAVEQSLHSLVNSLHDKPLRQALMRTLVNQALASLTIAKDSELAQVYTVAHEADNQVIDVVTIIEEVLFYISLGLLIAAFVALLLRTLHTMLMACVDSYEKAQRGEANGKWMRFASWFTQILAYTACVLVVTLGVACACIDAYVFGQIDKYTRLVRCSFVSDMVYSGVMTAVFGGIAIVTILIEPLAWLAPSGEFIKIANGD